MDQEPGEAVRAARIIVLGIGGLALAYLVFAPLVHYAAVAACGVLVGIALWSIADALARRTPLGYRSALALMIVVLVGACAGFVAWTGPRLADELAELETAIPEGIGRAREWLEQSALGRRTLARLDRGEMQPTTEMLRSVQRGVASGLGVVADVLIVMLLGLFFAAAPGRYLAGLLTLVPRARRARLGAVLRAIAATLRSWLGARLVLMTVIGAAFGIGLALLGIPLAAPIGVLTGALAFIPYVGALVALLPALAVAFLIGPEKALEVLVLYLAIQLVETHLLDPIVESRAVHLPPALVVIAQLVAVVYFGPVGVLIATPMLVAVVIAVQRLYVEDVLGDPAPAPEEKKRSLAFWRHRAAT